MQGPICRDCLCLNTCAAACPAWDELARIYAEQHDKDRLALIRNLRKQMGIREAKPSPQLRTLAKRIMNHFPEFAFIGEWNVKLGYVISPERKQGERIVYADCRKVQEVFQAYLPFDFIITFYERNTGFLNENQLKVLMLHELRHIQMGEKGLKLRPHDVEDFKDILDRYGLDWNEPGKELPDILDGE